MLAGQANLAGGAVVGDVTQCLTDTFSITNQNTVPVICGTNSGFHGKQCDIGHVITWLLIYLCMYSYNSKYFSIFYEIKLK